MKKHQLCCRLQRQLEQVKMDRDFGSAKQVLWPICVFSGIFTCKIIYELTGFLSSLHFEKYDKLSKEEKIEWKNRGFSTFHAIIVAAVAFYLVFISDVFGDRPDDEMVINKQSSISEYIFGISIGYFLADLGMILWLFPILGGKEYILHHGISIYSIFLALVSGKGHLYILMVLLSEATTPFVNLRWYLDHAGKKNSMLYLYNGIALFLGWLIIYQLKPVFPLGFYSIFLVLPMLAVMNALWFWKIFKGMKKTISRKRHSQ